MRLTQAIMLMITVALLAVLAGCDSSRVYEQNETIPGNMWQKENRIAFQFEITDTTLRYNVLVNLRHTNFYPFSNLWVMAYTTYPDGENLEPERLQLQLADTDGKWYGECIGDICDLQQYIQTNVRFSQTGTYKIAFEQIMRSKDVPVIENLPAIMAVGLRVEKVTEATPAN